MIDKELIHQAAEDIDIFEADLSEEFERLCPPPRRFPLWPLAAAACAAGIAFILLMPPRKTEPEPLPYTAYTEMWQYEEGQSLLDAQLAHQQEIKEKGERLAAYIRQQTITNFE